MNPRLGSRLYDFRTGRDTNVPTFSTFTTLDLTTFTTLPTLAHDSLTTLDFTAFRLTTFALTTLEQAERSRWKGVDRRDEGRRDGDETALTGRALCRIRPTVSSADPLTRCSGRAGQEAGR